MLTKYMFIAGCIPFLVLGTLHTLYTIADTFHPNRLVPNKPEVIAVMKATTLALTKETDMWRAWVGFNISHGVGLLFFSNIYLYLATAHITTLSGSIFLLSGAPLVALIYLILSKKYWFSIPVIGSTLGLLCFVGGTLSAIYS